MPTLNFTDDTEYVILTIDNTFLNFIQIDNLVSPINELNNNTLNVNLDNMEAILNNKSINKDVTTCEKIYASIKSKYPELSNIKLKDIYLANLQEHITVLIPKDNDFHILEVNIKKDNLSTKKIKLSEPYKIFNPRNFSNIPIIYKRKAIKKDIRNDNTDTLKVNEIKHRQK